MGKIMYTEKSATGGEINHIAGVVTYVGERIVNDIKVANIGTTLSVYNPETKSYDNKYLSIGFWNSTDETKPQLADNVLKARVAKGSFLMMVVGELKENDPATDGTARLSARGLYFTYNGKRELKNENGEVIYNLFCGTACNPRESEGVFDLNIPINTRAGAETETTWYSIRFTNNDKNTLADQATKLMNNKVPVCILTDAVVDKVTETQVFHNTNGVKFAAGFAKEAPAQPE